MTRQAPKVYQPNGKREVARRHRHGITTPDVKVTPWKDPWQAEILKQEDERIVAELNQEIEKLTK